MSKRDKVRAILERELELDYVSTSVVDDVIQAARSGDDEKEMVSELVDDKLYDIRERLKKLERELGIK